VEDEGERNDREDRGEGGEFTRESEWGAAGRGATGGGY